MDCDHFTVAAFTLDFVRALHNVSAWEVRLAAPSQSVRDGQTFHVLSAHPDVEFQSWRRSSDSSGWPIDWGSTNVGPLDVHSFLHDGHQSSDGQTVCQFLSVGFTRVEVVGSHWVALLGTGVAIQCLQIHLQMAPFFARAAAAVQELGCVSAWGA